jgi:CshA-type fibril repeat protein
MGEGTITAFVNFPADPIVDLTLVGVDYNKDGTFTPVVNGTLIQQGQACLVTSSGCVKEVTILDQGTFTVNSDDSVSFVPVDTFAGDYATVSYRVVDLWGHTGENFVQVYVALPAIPVVQLADQTVSYNRGTVFYPVTTGTYIQPQRACLVSAFGCGNQVVVDGEGTFTLQEDQSIVFTPVDTFAGGYVTATFLAFDLWGQIGEKTVSVFVQLPAAPIGHSASTTVNYNQSANLHPSATGTKLQPGWSCLVSGDTCVKQLFIEGKGTFYVYEDGSVSFTPLDTFAGKTAVATYRAYDLWHQFDENFVSVTVRLPHTPIVEPANTTVNYNSVATLAPAITGTMIQYDQSCLVSGADCVKELTIDGKGTFVVHDDSTVTFTPLDTFRGGLVWAMFRATDLWGQLDAKTISVNVLFAAAPIVEPASTIVDYNTSAILPVTVTGFKLTAKCLVSGEYCVTTLVIDGKGTFDVLEDGSVAFTPNEFFFGGLVYATYRAYDMWGEFGESTISVEVRRPHAPIVEPISVTVPYGNSVTLYPVAYGTKVLQNLACLVSGYDCLSTLTIDGKGTFTVVEGVVTFVPLSTFAGDTACVYYRVADYWGQTGEARLCVKVNLPAGPVVSRVSKPTNYNTPVDVTPVVSGSNIQYAQSCLIAGFSCQSSASVAGKGVFSVDSFGVVTFEPLSTFVGTATVTYRAYDQFGQFAENTLTVEVSSPAKPTVIGDSKTIDYNTVATLNPVVDGTLVQSDLTCIVSGNGCYQVVTIAGKGTFVVLADGSVTFTPVATFANVPVSVYYRVTDLWGQSAQALLTVTVYYPVALTVVGDSASVDYNQVAYLNPVVTGEQIQPRSACVFSDGACVRVLVIPAVGTFRVLDDGSVTFTPVDTFAGDSVSVSYRAFDVWNRPSNTGTLTVTVAKPAAPVATGDSISVNYNQPGTLYPVVYGSKIATVCLVSGSDCSTLVVPGKGTFKVAANGRVVFTPVDTFVGGPVSASYVATDLWGQQSAAVQLSVTVLAPAKPVVSASLATIAYQSASVNLMPYVSGTMIDNSAACLVSGSDCVKSLTVDGKGTFVVLSDGSVTFTPLSTFAGDIVWVTYRATDAFGQSAENTIAVTVSLPVAPIVSPATVSVDYNKNAVFTPSYTGTSIVSACLVSGLDCVTSLEVADKGTFTVVDGVVTFDPLPTFAGETVCETYKVADRWGQSSSAVVCVTVKLPAGPIVSAVSKTVDYNTVVDVTPVVSGSNIQYAQSCLIAGFSCQSSASVAGKGVFSVDSFGVVTFEPLSTFVGTATVTYRAYDQFGQFAENTLTVEVSSPAKPTVIGDSKTIDYNTVATLNPVVDGTLVQSDLTCIVSGNGCYQVVTIAGKGTFVVLADGSVTFTPVATFANVPVSVYYRVTDLWGQSAQALLTVTVYYPVALTVVGDSASVDYNQVAYLNPVVTGEQIQPRSACVFSDGACVRVLVIPAVGTFRVLDDGSVTFTPVDTFAGDSVSVSYRAFDVWNRPSNTGTLTVTVAKPAAPVATGDSISVNYNQPGTLYPVVYGSKIATVCLVSGSDCSTLVVPGKGTFKVAANGRVVFTPVDTFVGGPVSASYVATDLWGQQSAAVQLSVTVLAPAKPVVSASLATIAYQSASVNLMPYVSGTMIDNSAACLVSGSDCVKSLTVDGKGTFVVLSDGSVTFTPLSTFAGDIVWVTYRATDAFGQSAENTIAVTVLLPVGPIVGPQQVSVAYGASALLQPVVTGTDVQTPQACLIDGANCVKQLVVAGKGTFEVLDNGTVTFVPFDVFAGGIAWAQYRAFDRWGQYATNNISVVVALAAAPNLDSARVTTDYATPTDITPVTDSPYIDNGRTCLVNVNGCSGTKTVPGKGSFNVNSDGTVTFTPDENFAAGTVCATLRVYDIWGQFTQSQICVTVLAPAAPEVDPVDQTIAYGEVPTVTPGVTGFKLMPSQACIVNGLRCVKSFTVARKGTFVVQSNGDVTFTPISTFVEQTVVVTYRAFDMWGQSGENTITIQVSLPDAPQVNPAIVTVDYNTVATVAPAVAGTNIQVNLACLVSGNTCVKTLVVDGKGTFIVLDDGSVEFTPLDTFAGSLTATYRATDFFGTPGENYVLVTVRSPALSVTGDSATVGYNSTATLVPIFSGTKLALDSACLVSGGSCLGALTVAGKGTFTVLSDGRVTFVPLSTFVGTISGISFCISDAFGQQSCAELSVTVNQPAALVVTPQTVNTSYETATSFTPVVSGDAINYASVCLVDSIDTLCKTTVTVAGVGTWTVSTTDGRVTFTPATGYSGTATVEYRISNSFSQQSHATMSVVVSGTANLNGIVWLDLNHNGLQDPGEPVLAGILVTAGSTQPARFGAASANSYSVRTDADGRYSFDVVPGTYEVKAFLNSSYLFTSSSKDTDTKQVETTSTWVATLAAVGDRTVNTNFAAAGNGAIDGAVVFTSGATVPKATVSCVWSGFDGVLGTADDVLITATADANGKFSLSGIPGGQFQCDGNDPKSGKPATRTVVNVKGTSNPNVAPVKTKVVLPIKIGGKFVFTVSNFKPGSPAITAAIKAQIVAFVKKYKQATAVGIVGFTQGPTVLKVDYKLSLDRAKNALAIIQSINAKIKLIAIKNVQENRIGANIRRVVVTLYW